MINRLAAVIISHSSSTEDTYCIRGVRWRNRLASEMSTSASDHRVIQIACQPHPLYPETP
jgi:hypothetical protein